MKEMTEEKIQNGKLYERIVVRKTRQIIDNICHIEYIKGYILILEGSTNH